MTALVVAGASVFLLLGIAHAALTLRSKPNSGPLAPTSPEVQAAMASPTGLGMARELDTTLWRAWVGFNLSHALGVIVTASVVLFHALDDLDQAVHNAWYLVLTLVTPVIYLLLSIRYWFARPTRGIAVGGVLLAVGVFGARLT